LSSNPSSRESGQAPLPDELVRSLALVRPRLGRLGSTIVYFPTIGSTNDVAATLAGRADTEGAVVIADAQTAGRGRRGRDWFSPPGSGLYVSVVLTPGRAPRDLRGRATRLVTLAAGVAIAEAVQTVTGLGVDVKWPNDLYIARRKLAGILAEAAGSGTDDPLVLGYGINVGPMSYPPELRDRATSLETELGRRIDRALLIAESLAAVARRYDDLLAGRFDAILDAWRSRAPGSTGALVAWSTASGLSSGVTAGIDEDGALLVAVGHRVERIVAGEVQWL
jgi:BirA family transcriptional regulator, biotin operon repressor / biotin---[acetyl-CoA-carboxylase] ligase